MEFTLDRLVAIMRECAGEDEQVDLTGPIEDTLFYDLGYDSLAVLQTTALIERDHRIVLDEDEVAEVETPRALITLVNASLARLVA